MRHSLASISPGFGGGGGGGGGDSSINSSPWDGTSREEGRQLGPGPKTHWGAAVTTSSASSPLPLLAGGWGCGARATGVPGPRLALPSASPGEEKGGSRVPMPGWRRPRGRPPPLCAPAAGRCARRGGCCGARGAGLSRCAPGGGSQARPSGLRLLRRLRLPRLKEDSAQPNSSLIIPAQI
ncbi:translation initiation factor IF-2-like [Zalophus californianus]|uniref:Translation initiation factor IF-2-like n=1 Tax=Zalophus californianus TaxID=9704 RepID=A0A6J2DYQ7_ZALCA|nr:translation initiation factor IF-2-like [Zalophus californianus]